MANRVFKTNIKFQRIKKCAALPQLQSIALELNDLISFLNITIYQEYLVHRLKELSDGGAMSQFNWNGGGRFKGRHYLLYTLHCIEYRV